jgi:predicted transcriptional regulator
MACVNPEGQLSENARQALRLLSAGPRTPEELAAISGSPLYRVRANLRELAKAGLAAPDGDRYQITATGKQKI